MNLKILILPGDGIGAEVTRAAVAVLKAVAKKFGHTLELSEGLLGGVAIHKTGTPLPDETLAEGPGRRRDADGRGGAAGVRQRAARASARKEGCWGCARRSACSPTCAVRTWPALIESSPLKNHLVEGTDMIIVRELTGGLYYGEPRGIVRRITRCNTHGLHASGDRADRAHGVSSWREDRRKKLTSVDKSNVLENSQLWRRVVTKWRANIPDVELDHLLVDNCAMQLVLNPRRFDVLLTENMFGDILSDEGAVLAGSIGMLPSASLGRKRRDCTSRCTARLPTSPGRTRPIRWAPSDRWAPCSNTRSGLTKEAAAVNAAIGTRARLGPRHGGLEAQRHAGDHRK